MSDAPKSDAPKSDAPMSDAPMSDAEADLALIEATLNGNLQAFDLLVKKYQSRIVSLANRMVKDSATAEDIAQETFIKAYRALPNFRQDSAFYTWLYRIGINTAKNHLSSRHRTPSSHNEEFDEASQMGRPQLQEQATPERQLMAEDLKKVIDQSLAELPEELKVAFLLRELEGLSYEDISHIMECPIGTVRSRIFRARESISKRIEEMD